MVILTSKFGEISVVFGRKDGKVVVKRPSKLHYNPALGSERQKDVWVHMAIVANSGRGIEGTWVYPATGEKISAIAIYVAFLRLGEKGNAIGLMFNMYPNELGSIELPVGQNLPDDKTGWNALLAGENVKVSQTGLDLIQRILALPPPPHVLTKSEKLHEKRAKQDGRWDRFIKQYETTITKYATIEDLAGMGVGSEKKKTGAHPSVGQMIKATRKQTGGKPAEIIPTPAIAAQTGKSVRPPPKSKGGSVPEEEEDMPPTASVSKSKPKKMPKEEEEPISRFF